MDVIEEIKKDFRKFADKCMGILLYGSYAKGEQTPRSDVDVCIVGGEKIFEEVMRELGGKYDIKFFEELPLYVKVEVVKNHVKIYAKEELDMYFYRILKVWKDMEHRIRENEFESIDEKIKKRRRWLNAKKKILREIRMD